MPRQIPDSELIEGDLPVPDAAEEAIWAFARTFDGYEYIEFRNCQSQPLAANLVWRLGMVLANPARGQFFRNGAMPPALSDLRACLFFEWRRLHHQGVAANSDMMRYLHALVEAMRRKIRDSANEPESRE